MQTLNKLWLGEILVTTGQISRDQFKSVLNRSKISKKKIGRLLTAALISALSMSNMLVGQEAHGANVSLSSKIQISARVLPSTTITVLSQVPELVVKAADIKREYIEVPAATRIRVKSNNPAGYLLAFEPTGAIDSVFSSVSVLIAGREVQLSPNGTGWIPQPYIQGGVIQDITYRFALSKNAQPGTYNWPFMISVYPI